MDPTTLLELLCRRHGVTLEFGKRFLPLVERAVQAPEDVRERILKLVEGSLKREGKRKPRLRDIEDDEELLVLVAKVLDGWAPPGWLLDWEDTQGET